MVSAAAPPPLPWLAAPLAEALRAQRGHALLVHGPQGVGQFEFAIELARAWLCEGAAADRPGGMACGRCESCHLVAPDQLHPDLRVLLPEAMHLALGWRAPGDGAEPEGGGGSRKPSAWISIDQVRAAIAFSTLTRARGAQKVVVVHPAERMPQAAASALLKLLEEPADGQRFVLSCGDAAALMPTVRSRCHAVRLPLPARDEALGWLQAQGIEDAGLVLDAAGGQPLAALERHALGLDAAFWRRLPGAARHGDAAPLAGLPVALAVDALQKVCHDALLAACGAPPRYLPAGSLPAGGDVGRLTAWAAELGRVARHGEHPWNASLMAETLVRQAARALAPARGEGDAPGRAAARPGASRQAS